MQDSSTASALRRRQRPRPKRKEVIAIDLAIHLLELLTTLAGLVTAIAQALADMRGRTKKKSRERRKR